MNKENVADDADKVVVTVKDGPNYDSPWVVVHAPDMATAKRHVDELVHEMQNAPGRSRERKVPTPGRGPDQRLVVWCIRPDAERPWQQGYHTVWLAEAAQGGC